MNNDRSLHNSAYIALSFIGLLWLINMFDAVFHLQLVRFGVFPRETEGLKGIFFAPLIHSGWYHLAANTAPLFVLGTAMIYGYPRASKIALPMIYLLSGLGVWLYARSSYHIGASGITHGMIFFIFTIGVLRRDKLSIVLSMIVFFLYGGMIWSIFPQQEGISFESHFFGATAGVLMAVLLRNFDIALPEKKYEWENDEYEDDDDER